jgi:Type ISP C-terminal specificity domain
MILPQYGRPCIDHSTKNSFTSIKSLINGVETFHVFFRWVVRILFSLSVTSAREARLVQWQLIASLICTCLPALMDFQCFPFYVYDEDGSNRRENITDWALNEFRTHYSDPNITKWDIFHYVYAVLHHPEYRERYAANLKRELPRIPFVGFAPLGRAGLQAGVEVPPLINGAGLQPGGTSSRGEKQIPQGLKPLRDDKQKEDAGRGAKAPLYQSDGEDGGSPGLQAGDKNRAEGASSLPKAGAQPQAERPIEIFRAFADAGKRLADLHVNYEQQPEYTLERVEKGQLNWRVEKMRLSKDKTALIYNEFLTLKGIPPETCEYRLGNRSALEWVIDQYQVSTDKRSGITNDPNRADDPEYIVHLIGRVITVSLETMKIVKALPKWAVADSAEGRDV